jgi:hypothetical protein
MSERDVQQRPRSFRIQSGGNLVVDGCRGTFGNRGDVIFLHQSFHKYSVFVRDLCAQAGDEVVWVTERNLLGDQQVNTIWSPVNLFLDPGQLCVQLFGRIRGCSKHSQPTCLGYLRNNSGRAVEPYEGVLDA